MLIFNFFSLLNFKNLNALLIYLAGDSDLPGSPLIQRIFHCLKSQESDSDCSTYSDLKGRNSYKSKTLDFGQLNGYEIERECNQHRTPNSVRKVSLHHTDLNYVTGAVAKFRSLVHLELSHNKIKFISCQLAELHKLKVLDLSYNELDEIPMAVLLMESLETLNVKHNQIQYLPTGLLELTSLRTLECEDNPILAPPPDVCCLGAQYIFRALRDQRSKINLLGDFKPYYSTEKKVTLEPLFKLCTDFVVRRGIDYKTMSTIPPKIKNFLNLVKSSNETRFHPIMKCSKCRGYFSQRHLFLNHLCDQLRRL